MSRDLRPALVFLLPSGAGFLVFYAWPALRTFYLLGSIDCQKIVGSKGVVLPASLTEANKQVNAPFR